MNYADIKAQKKKQQEYEKKNKKNWKIEEKEGTTYEVGALKDIKDMKEEKKPEANPDQQWKEDDEKLQEIDRKMKKQVKKKVTDKKSWVPQQRQGFQQGPALDIEKDFFPGLGDDHIKAPEVEKPKAQATAGGTGYKPMFTSKKTKSGTNDNFKPLKAPIFDEKYQPDTSADKFKGEGKFQF